jgi:hypothetical protein
VNIPGENRKQHTGGHASERSGRFLGLKRQKLPATRPTGADLVYLARLSPPSSGGDQKRANKK